MWSFPNVQELASLIPSSECWDCEDLDDDIFEMPMHTINNIDSKTSEDQLKTEKECGKKIKLWLLRSDILASTVLNRRKCIQYCSKGLISLSSGYSNLDCSRTWICYWIINSLNLLSAEMHITNNLQESLIQFISSCQHPKGGFAGGPMQYAHMAASFGAVMALLSIGTKPAYDAINRQTFYDFILRQHQSDGSFSVQDGGEIDIRAAYCGLACASILNIIDEILCLNTLLWLSKCQTYQGGFAQEPNDEAHGGYAYCGTACYLIIQTHFPHLINNKNKINLEKLIRWQTFKQMQYSGGFQGRTHKLVDACYSFWVGAVFPIIYRLKQINNEVNHNDNDEKKNDNDNDNDNSLFNTLQLQKYILICCQHIQGGISDKPPKPSDYYHTCYGLSGLSIAQNYDNKLLGPKTNKLESIDPVYGIVEGKLLDAWNYYREIDNVKKNKNTQIKYVNDSNDINNTQIVDKSDL
eukprot:428760_1